MNKKRLLGYALMAWPLIGGLVCLFVFAGWMVTSIILGCLMTVSVDKGIDLLVEADREDFYRKLHGEDRVIGEWEDE